MIALRDKLVVALGGNALIRTGEDPTIATQSRNVAKAMRALVPLVRRGNRLIVTHGNGFQVGNILIRVEEALGKAYPIPLELCVAESQGEIGFMLEQALQNALLEQGLQRPVLSVLTSVVVDARDPAFAAPSKPIGPAYTDRQAAALKRRGFAMTKEPRRGWRKLVASPQPLEIDDVEVLRWLLRRDVVVIAAGGGGVPVIRKGRRLVGAPAVIDKDRASAVLAHDVGARHMLILTGESCVYRDYATDRQRPLRRLGIAEAERYLADGQFPPGSMGPKVEASIDFVRRGRGRSVLITDAEHLGRTLQGRAGTTITRSTRKASR